jgi:hypothetical protein
MLRNEEYCWIKVEPFRRTSYPSRIHILLNGEDHKWDIYDKNGKEANKVYFKGFVCKPCFYLESGNSSYQIECNFDNIQVITIMKSYKISDYIKINCNCISPETSCWAINTLYTRRVDKHPFNLM